LQTAPEARIAGAGFSTLTGEERIEYLLYNKNLMYYIRCLVSGYMAPIGWLGETAAYMQWVIAGFKMTGGRKVCNH
jgi:hypothetical protein